MVYFAISLYQQKYLHMNIQKKFLDRRRTLKNKIYMYNKICM